MSESLPYASEGDRAIIRAVLGGARSPKAIADLIPDGLMGGGRSPMYVIVTTRLHTMAKVGLMRHECRGVWATTDLGVRVLGTPAPPSRRRRTLQQREDEPYQPSDEWTYRPRMTPDQVATWLGMTRQRVQQLEQSALDKIRKGLADIDFELELRRARFREERGIE